MLTWCQTKWSIMPNKCNFFRPFFRLWFWGVFNMGKGLDWVRFWLLYLPSEPQTWSCDSMKLTHYSVNRSKKFSSIRSPFQHPYESGLIGKWCMYIYIYTPYYMYNINISTLQQIHEDQTPIISRNCRIYLQLPACHTGRLKAIILKAETRNCNER